MTPKVEGNKVKSTQSVQQKNKTPVQEGYYTVKAGDTVSKLVKAFNFKSEQEFRNYVKMSGTAYLKKDEKIPMPTAKLETTISAIARKYNCPVSVILSLNPQIKDPAKLPKGAVLLVPAHPFTNSENKSSAEVKPVDQQTSTQQTKPAAQKAPADNPKATTSTAEAASSQQTSNVQKPTQKNTMEDSADKIAKELKDAGSAWTWNPLNSKKFKTALAKINKDNVKDVIKAYDKISKSESLIDMICSEVTSSQELRKAAVMDIYHKLADSVGKDIATREKEDAFKAELDKEFAKRGGFVSAKNLDKMLNTLVSSTNSGPQVGLVPGNTKILVNGKNTDFTVESLHNDWQKGAKKWNRTAARPLPSVDEKGNIVADVKILQPTGKGKLSGKTIIVNPGHGGAMCGPNDSLTFDPGASNARIVTKKVRGKTIQTEHASSFIGNGGNALEEWALNKDFADELARNLTAQGAKVVYIQGSVHVVPKAMEKYRKDADMVISLHANSSSGSDGVIILPTTSKGKDVTDSADEAFADIIHNNLEADKNFTGRTRIRTQGLAVLRDTDGKAYPGPDIMIETGNLKSEKDVANLINPKYRTAMVSGITNSVVDYLNPSKKK